MLDSAWVDRIHARLLVRYGSAWIAKFQGIDESLVKHDWSEVLSGVRADSIKHALEHLPTDFPPTATQFRDLCFRSPEPSLPRLAAPKANPEVVAAALAAMQKPGNFSHKAWAYRLQKREADGDRLTKFQRDAWREALGVGKFATHEVEEA